MVVDLFLKKCFHRLSNEFSSVCNGEGFDVIEDLSVGCVFGGNFEVIEVGGGAFKEQFAGGLGGAIGACGHSKKKVRGK